MQIKVDTHTHTLASGHAYNTIREMALTALEKDLEGLAITEHAPEMQGSCCLYYFQNLNVIPRKSYGIPLLLGTELNIMDEHGNIDLPISTLKSLDITVASIHPPCYGKSLGKDLNTAAYVNAMQNDCIDIIGHPDDGRFPADYNQLAKIAKETGTLLEINNSSLRPGGYRINTQENALEILKYCKKYGTMITLGSDAHIDADIANTEYSSKILEAADFPEELVANTSLEKLLRVLKRNR